MAVSSVNLANHSMTLSHTTSIAVGDTVLIVQMKGATIDQSNNSDYGDVMNWNAAGGYEYNEVCDIQGNTVIFKREFLHNYNSGGAVQVVTVPTYTNAEVSATLTANPWNGSDGGIVALRVYGTLELNADVDVSGLGFRGGAHDSSVFDCNFVVLFSDYEYSVASGLGAMKGEGIANYTALNGGKGALANGGGGGNDHNSGGGGGGLFTAGGQGGDNDDPNSFNCHGYDPGEGGKAMSLPDNRIFFGGGGGAGHSNSGNVNTAGNGGGIVLIECDELIGNGQAIITNGTDALDGFGDGAGAGGAGGMILLIVNNYTGTLNAQAIGGNGGNADGFSSARCFGPGGGGAGGTVWVSNAILPGSINTNLAGGNNGVVTNTTAGCIGQAQNAEPGSSGIPWYNFSVPMNNKCNKACWMVPQVELGNDTTVCIGDNVILDAGAFSGVTYSWSTGDNTQTISVAANGEYSVAIDNGECVVCDTINVITVSQPADIEEEYITICESVTTLDAGNSGATYSWSTGETTQQITIDERGVYHVVISIGACMISDSVTVFECLDVPNTITPNGDGLNDTWIIEAIETYENHVVQIFNRNGNLLYESSNYQNDWNGEGLPATTYYYYVDLGDGSDAVTGHLNIVREK